MNKEIFPTIIYTEHVNEISDQENEIIKKECYSLCNCGETTFFTNKSLHGLDVFKNLCIIIEKRVISYVHSLGFQGAIKWGQMWLTISEKGGHHGLHHHKGALIAGTYYVSIPKDEPLFLDFYDERIRISSSEYSEKIEDKKLILFEGSVLHGFKPNPSREHKIALSFNFLPAA